MKRINTICSLTNADMHIMAGMRGKQQSKKQNVTGLQLADLIAYPITQYLLYPDRVNFTYDIVKDSIYVSDGTKLGLKVIPRPEMEV